MTLAGAVPPALDRFLASQGLPGALSGWRPLVGGRAADTYLATVGDEDPRDVVVRLAASTGPTAEVALSLSLQFDLLRALAATPVPAPVPLCLCTDEEVLGRQFLVTEFAPGEVPSPWSRSGREALGRSADTLARSIVETLATVHAVGVDQLPAALRDDEVTLRDQLKRWTAIVEDSPFRRDPLLIYARKRLEADLVTSSRRALVHGDYRLGNLVIEGGRVERVLDWEMATVGDPAFDLALLCAPPLAVDWERSGLGSVDDLPALYAETTGTTLAADEWRSLVLLATYKVVAIWINGGRRWFEGFDELPALRSALSAIGARRFLLHALGVDPPPDSSREASRTVAAARRLVPGSAEDSAADPSFKQALALLRALPPAVDRPRLFGLAADIAAFRRDVGLPLARSLDPLGSLAQTVEETMEEGRLVDPTGDATHARLLDLVRRSADPSLHPLTL